MRKDNPKSAGMAAADPNNFVAIRGHRRFATASAMRAPRLHRRAPHTEGVTYAALLRALRDDVTAGGSSASAIQRGRNAASALNAWLAFLEATANQLVGVEFDAAFESTLKRFLAYETQRGMKLLTLRDRRRWILRARDLLIRLRQHRLPQTFGGVLALSIQESGITLNTIAARIGLSAQTLRLWIHGTRLPGRSARRIADLESALGLPPRTLLARLPARVQRKAMVPPRPKHAYTEYGTRIRNIKLTKERIGLQVITAALRAEWRALLEHKTATIADFADTPEDLWRARPRADMRYTRPEWVWALDAERVVPTAAIVWHRIQGYLGWLTLPPSRGGHGISVSDVQSLAWLTQADLVANYLKWCASRAGGKFNTGATTFLVNLRTLLRPETGYIARQANFSSGLPENRRVNAAAWGELCARAYEQYGKLRRTIAARVVQTRNGWDPLKGFIGLRNTLEPIVEALRSMRAELPGPTSPLQRAQGIRDILVLELFLVDPLRCNQWAFARYRADNTGNLYRTAKAWRVRFKPEDFKNPHGAAGDGPYDVELPRRAWPVIDEYLKDARPVLLRGAASDYFVVGGRTPGHAPWNGIDAVIRRISRQYFTGRPSLGPQAFRKLVATFWLKQSPRNYPVVAKLLNDRIATVIAAYAFLDTEEAFENYSDELDKAFG